MTERELERRANRRLAVLRHVEEVSGNVAATCRYYGISRQCYYGWLRRYEADGIDGLKDRSSRPHLPLAPARQRHRPRQDQTPDAAAERQSGKIPPHRLRRVLPAPRGPSDRRHPLVHRQTAGVGGLLQLPSPSRRSRWPNTLRAPPPESPRPTVIGLRQLHTAFVGRVGLEPTAKGL